MMFIGGYLVGEGGCRRAIKAAKALAITISMNLGYPLLLFPTEMDAL